MLWYKGEQMCAAYDTKIEALLSMVISNTPEITKASLEYLSEREKIAIIPGGDVIRSNLSKPYFVLLDDKNDNRGTYAVLNNEIKFCMSYESEQEMVEHAFGDMFDPALSNTIYPTTIITNNLDVTIASLSDIDFRFRICLMKYSANRITKSFKSDYRIWRNNALKPYFVPADSVDFFTKHATFITWKGQTGLVSAYDREEDAFAAILKGKITP